MAAGFAEFETAIGRCGIAWRGGTIIGTALPEKDGLSPKGRLAARLPQSQEQPPPPEVQHVFSLVVRLLDGERVSLAQVEIDLTGIEPFEQAVYAAARAIPVGETRTYGELAEATGFPGAARAVGSALGRNPFPIIVPCHRIVAASGRSGGFTAPGGVAAKLRILDIERARRGAEPGLFEELPWAVRPSR